MSPGVLLFVSLCSLVAGLLAATRYPRLWLALMLVAAIPALAASLKLAFGAPDWEWQSSFLLGGEHLHFRLDGVSALFLSLLAVLGGAGAVYSSEYWSDRDHPRSAPRSRLWWAGIVFGMGLALLSSNGLHFLIGWEFFTVSAYFLITLENRRREVRAAGWLYFAASHVGTLCLFAFFATLASRTGSWDLGPMRDRAEFAPLFWLILFGCGVKAGLFPLHVWLPSAHANAPSHVSAILSGVAIKMGVYGLVRFSGWLPMPPAAGWTLVGVGALTALFGVVFALVQNDIKRLLAYCSIENVGIILIGLGCGLIGLQQGNPVWASLALAGGLLHVLNHGLFKGLLFFGAGSVLHATGTREMSRLGGLWKAMPWTAGFFAFGAVAISGLPPLNGFVSEWLVYLGLFGGASGRGHAAWAVMPTLLLMATTGALALACFVKAGTVMFLGAPRTKVAVHAHECGTSMRGSMLLLAVLCTLVGLFPMLAWPVVGRAVSSWSQNPGLATAPESLGSLGMLNLVLALAIIAGAALLWSRARSKGLRRALTWDCGYAQPAPRMQYTSGSFAGTGGAWFFWILWPEREVRRVRGAFPREGRRVEHVPETVLDRILRPVGSSVLFVSSLMRRLQHGRLPFYILYLLAGLTALGGLVLFQGSR